MGLGSGLVLRQTETRRTKDSVLSQRKLKIGLYRATLLLL